MKINLLIAFCLLLNIGFAGAKTGNYADKTSVTITETENSCQLTALFNEAETKKIQNYMDDYLTRGTGCSFKNVQSDADITLDSKITFYMKTGVGKLILKLDKRKNSAELYNRFKKMCEGIRDIIQKK
jgi:hypothetical protein